MTDAKQSSQPLRERAEQARTEAKKLLDEAERLIYEAISLEAQDRPERMTKDD